MIGTYSSRRTMGGFDPRVGTSTVFRARPGFLRAAKTLVLGLALGLGLTVAAASPAFASSAIVARGAISAPQGFRGVCDRYAWACLRSASARVTDTGQMLRLADRMNRRINGSVREISDARQYRRQEYWALPTAKGGDCEDFALLKKRELIRAGLAPDRLLIATVLDRRRNAHAVLVLRTDEGDFVLDNLTDRMKPWRETGYSFIRMQDPRAASGWRLIMKGGIFG